MDAVDAATAMHVPLSVLHVCMPREPYCVRVTAMPVWVMDEASAGHVGGTRGAGIVSSAADALWRSVVREEPVEYVCEMCVFLDRGGVCGEGAEWIFPRLHQSRGNR